MTIFRSVLIFWLLIIGFDVAFGQHMLFNSKATEPPSEMQIKDLSLEPYLGLDIDSYYVAPVDKPIKPSKDKNTELRIVPGEDLYKLFEDSDYRIIETIKKLDLTKPPVKTELKIRF